MRNLSEEERSQLRTKIQQEQLRRQQVVQKALREHDEEDMHIAWGRHAHGIVEFLVDRIPGMNFRRKIVIGLLLPFIIGLIVLLLILFGYPVNIKWDFNIGG